MALADTEKAFLEKSLVESESNKRTLLAGKSPKNKSQKEDWNPESGLVTSAFKIKRRPIQDFYQKEIDRMLGK